MLGRLTIQLKIILGFMVLLMAFALAVNTVFVQRFSQQNQVSNEEALSMIYNSLEAEILNRANTAAAIAETLATTPSIQSAFAGRDREVLSDLTAPVMKRVKAQFGVKQLQFHTPDSHSFLRAHKPAKFGDDLSGFRHTVNQANLDRQPATGIEIGVAGIGVRGVVPVSQNSQHLGTVEAGLSLDESFLKLFKQHYDVDVAFYLMRDSGLELHSETAKLPFAMESLDEIFAGEEPSVFDSTSGESSSMSRVSVLKDFQGAKVGVVVVSKDITVVVATQNEVLLSILLVTLVGLLLSAIAGTFIAKSISRPLGAEPRVMDELSSRVAQGNLELTDTEKSPIGVYKSLRSMVVHLKSTVSEVDNSVAVISEQAQRMNDSSDGLHQRTGSQADSLQSTADAMQELTATVEQNADNAQYADELAKQLSEQASKGGEIVSRVVEVMADISSSSTKATEIITVIDEIAFQTNLLALNAAVEAARAGDSGRGFAVVATEVRNLAQRSANAAKDIKGLIEDNVSHVGKGAGLVDNAGNSLNEILGSVASLNQTIGAIALANSEQVVGLSQINNAISDIENSTQINNELAEESSVIAQALTQEAGNLDELMSYFRQNQSVMNRRPSRVS